MQAFFQQYIKKHFDFQHLFKSKAQLAGEAQDFNSFKVSSSRRIWLWVVSIAHWFCFAGFGMSLAMMYVFKVDFADWAIPFSGEKFDPIELLKMLSVSGLIGYGTNYIAIQMLFHPIDKRPVWGQGLVPAQRERIIYTLSFGLHKHILSEELIVKNLEAAGFSNRIVQFIINGASGLMSEKALTDAIKAKVIEEMQKFIEDDQHQAEIVRRINLSLDKSLEGGFKKMLISAYKKYNAEEYDELVRKMLKEVPPIAGEVLDTFTETQSQLFLQYLTKKEADMTHIVSHLFAEVLAHLDIPALLRKQMAHFDDRKLERMIWDATNEQLLYIQYLGTILGVLGGFIIWQPVLMLSVYAVLFGGLMLLDVVLFKRGKVKGGG